MKICIVTKYLPPEKTDGIPRNRWEYAKQFASKGHEVHIITSGVTYIEEIRDNIFIHRIPSFDDEIHTNYLSGLNLLDHTKHLLCYSYLVFLRVKALNEKIGIDIVDAPLWDLEGYLTKLFLPGIPMALRLESTPMLIKEIRYSKFPDMDDQNHLESHFLKIADAYLFDSWSIVKETERLYQIDLSGKPSAMIYHGIELDHVDLAVTPLQPRKNTLKKFKIIAVGRMEKRKGTDIIFKEILPYLFEELNDIEIHFAGFDNAEWDGFKDETGLFYKEYVKKNFSSQFNESLFIHGYISDDELNDLYDSADCVLALSRYESFGLLYVEAMRKMRPLIVFDTGTVPELFEHDEDALIAPISNPREVVGLIKKLKENSLLGIQIAQNAFKKLKERFDAERMGRECLVFFEHLVNQNSEMRVFQVMNALSDRDGVSNITLQYDDFLKAQKTTTQIIGTWATDAVKDRQRPIESVTFKKSDIILYHYWNYCDRGDYFNKLNKGKKVFVFHNMTTPSFFDRSDEGFETTSRGFDQLQHMDGFDLYVGFSNYSLEILKQTIQKSIKTFLINPLLEVGEIKSKKFDNSIVAKYKDEQTFNILFVGRITPSKKQTDLIRFFAYYVTKINPNSRLIIIGGGEPKYIDQIKSLIKSSNIENKLVFLGKVSDEQLYSYYRIADVYLSMSEHEGFGVPLVEAMAFDIPVVAYSVTAVSDTVGDNGCLFKSKDNEGLGKLIEKVRLDRNFKNQVLEKQNLNLKKYSKESVKECFKEMAAMLHTENNKRNGGLQVEEEKNELLVQYNSNDIIKYGSWEYRKDDFLKFESKSDHVSKISISAEFESFEINFLMHEWGGKVKISVDDVYSQEVDLYSSKWRVEKKSGEQEFLFKPRTLSIEALTECNHLSKGLEVMIRNIRFFGSGGNQPVINLEKSDEITSGFLEGDIDFEKNGRLLNSVITEDVLKIDNEAFQFAGSWEDRDSYFKFNSGDNVLNTCKFQVEFSELELVFLTHPWSGIVKVVVDNVYTEVIDLYNEKRGLKHVKLAKSFEQAVHSVVIQATGKKNSDSHGTEIFLKEGLIYNFYSVKKELKHLHNEFKISINVNTMNRAVHLENLLKALDKQTYPYFEVVIVNGPSTDHTADVLEKYKNRIKVVNCPDANLTKSRNIGISNSAGNYVAYIDDDAIPCNERWLENYVNYLFWLKNDKLGALGGAVKHRDTDFYEFKNGVSSNYAEQIFDEEYLNGKKVDGEKWFYRVCGCNNIMLRDALYKIGGFDERMYHYLDETDVCLQMWRKGYVLDSYQKNYVRHYKATNNYRKSDIDIRWDIISRSDTFFGLKNGSGSFVYRLYKVVRIFSDKHFYKEIHSLYNRGDITKSTYTRYKKLMWKGFWQGIWWGVTRKLKKNYLKTENNDFKVYNAKPDFANFSNNN